MNRKSIQNELSETSLQQTTRRHFLRDCTTGLGSIYLASQLHRDARGSTDGDASVPTGKAKSVIYLHMVGAPSQLELFDYKPQLAAYDGQDCPQEYLEEQRFAFIQGTPKMLGPAVSVPAAW